MTASTSARRLGAGPFFDEPEMSIEVALHRLNGFMAAKSGVRS